MTQDKRFNDNKKAKESDANRRNELNTNSSKDSAANVPTKVVVRRLPPTLTPESFLEHISPIPDYDYFRFAEAEHALGSHGVSRAYFNFVNPKDVWLFQEKFDGYVFLDDKGNEYPAVVEFAPYSRISKKKTKKADPRKGTIEQDPDYLKFLEKLKTPELEPVAPPELLLEEIEAKEKVLKANHGCPKITTPLIEFLAKRKEERRSAFLHAREEKRRKEIEKRKQFEEERRKKIEKERMERREQLRQKQREKEEKKKEELPTTFRLLKNPEREKEKDEKERQADAELKEHDDRKHTTETSKTKRDEDNRGREQEKRSNFDANDRRMDDKKDNKDKNRKPEKTFGDRRKEDDRRHDRRDSESYTKDSNYGTRKRMDQIGDHEDKGREKAKESDLSVKDQNWEKGHERENGGRSGGYHSYGKQRERENYRDRRRDDGRRDDGRRDDGRRDDVRKVKGEYKFDSRKPKESEKASGKDYQHSRSDSGYGDHGGGRRYQESRGDRNNYDNRRDSGNYDSRRDTENESQSSHGAGKEKLPAKGRAEESKGNMGREFKEKESSPQTDESTESAKTDVTKSTKSKMAHDNEENATAEAFSKKSEDHESGGRGHSEKDSSGASSRQRVRYKDRPERAIYNPAKRAVERQKEGGSNR